MNGIADENSLGRAERDHLSYTAGKLVIVGKSKARKWLVYSQWWGFVNANSSVLALIDSGQNA